jgi:PTS system nitrogen regulatory IIA component
VEDWIRDEGLPHVPDRGRLMFDRAQVAQWAAGRGLAAQAGFLAPQTQAFSAGYRIEPLLRVGGIWRDVPVADLSGVYERVVASLPGATPPIRQLLAQRIRARDGVTLAPVGGGYALPHLSTRVALGRDSGAVALVLLRDALMPAEPRVDQIPVTRLLFFLAPSPRAHLDLLGRLSRLLLRKTFRELAARGAQDEEIFGAVRSFDASTSDIPSSEGTDSRGTP